MSKYYLAVDIGASSGRHIISHINKENKIVLEEVHRFENGIVERDGNLCWNLDVLFNEIIQGLSKCRKKDIIPESIGIDTWGVDFVLLDENDKVIGDTVAYRDNRTENMDKLVYEVISKEDLYARTGIQYQPFNTLYQLMAIKQNNPEYLERAKTLLLLPDYFNFLLTGVKTTEYTNATTTQLINAHTKNWDFELLESLGIKTSIFTEIKTPKTYIGNFTESIAKRVGYNTKVVLPATHDTGSAIVSVPYTDKKSIYISSGTWSLMGVEEENPNCSQDSCALNFTNEGGIDYRFRFLKNIMGLWLIQSVRRELGDRYTFAELCNMAEGSNFKSLIDCNDNRLIAPKHMIETIQNLCVESGQEMPTLVSDIAAVVYNSLANCYANTIKEIESITNNKYENIYIIGGGAKADYLNKLTKEYTNLNVKAIPIEATALGNLICQMIADETFTDLKSARECVQQSFETIHY